MNIFDEAENKNAHSPKRLPAELILDEEKSEASKGNSAIAVG